MSDQSGSLVVKPSISVITLTYGDRLHLLEQTCAGCLADPAVSDVYVVNNNSKSDLTQLTARWGGRIKLITLSRNTGSATGYIRGIDAAVAGGMPVIMMIDDDNVLADGALALLHRELLTLQAHHGEDKAGVFGSRLFQNPRQLEGYRSDFVYPRSSSFMGFSLLHTLQRKWMMRRGTYLRPEEDRTPVVPMGPYGGFMAGRALFQAIGRPEERFALYYDDAEYTYRVTANGGVMKLVLDAEIIDIDARQSEKIDEPTVFLMLLKAPSLFRLYYSVRNGIWFEYNQRRSNPVAYRVNRAIFLFFLKRTARKLGFPETYKVFLAAVQDAEADRLGENENYPLPQ